MEANQVPPPGETGAAEGLGAAPERQPVNAAPDETGDGQPAGLTRHLSKAWRALQRAGFSIDGQPASAPGPAAAAVESALGSSVAPVAAGAPFDETLTRTGVTGLVETADGFAAQFVTGRAVAIVGERDGAKFGERVKMTPAIKDGLINAGVEVCRVEGVNVPPHATLAVLLAGWLYGVHAAVKDLKALASARPVPEKKAE